MLIGTDDDDDMIHQLTPPPRECW